MENEEKRNSFMTLLYEMKDRQNLISVTVFLSDGRALTGYIGSHLPLLELINRRHNFVDVLEICQPLDKNDVGFWMGDVQDGASKNCFPLVYIFFTSLLGFVYSRPLGVS